MKKALSVIMVVVLVLSCMLICVGCSGTKSVTAKIGVIRGDASSVEALAWEQYMKDLASEMGVQIDFTTAIETADQELAAVQNYASMGYNGIIAMTAANPTNILEKCQEYKMYLVFAAAHPDFEGSDASLMKDESIVVSDWTNYPYYVGATGPSNYGEVLAGYQMGKAAVAAGFKTYSAFTGATAYGQPMHALRLAGWFAAMHEADSTVTYNGISCTLENWKELTVALQSGLGIDLAAFSSEQFKIVAQTGGYNFLMGDTAAAAAVAQLSSAEGVECVFCAGSADAIANFAPEGVNVKYVGNDSLGEAFEGMFANGKLVFDIAKYNSYVGPAFAMLLKSIYNDSAIRIDGKPISIEQGSLQISQASDYDTINAVENKEGGYFFSSEFLSAYILETKLGENASGYTQITDEAFAKICGADATLTEGGLYELTKAVTDSFIEGKNEIFVFTTAEE